MRDGTTFSMDTKKVAFASAATDMGQGQGTGSVTSPQAVIEQRDDVIMSPKDADESDKVFEMRDSVKRHGDSDSDDNNAAQFARRQTLSRIKTMKLGQEK